MLRRHDYNVNVAGDFGAAQLTSDYMEADGLRLPTRCRAYARGPDRRPISEVKRAAREQGMRLLRESAVERVLDGLTTLREINKVTFVE